MPRWPPKQRRIRNSTGAVKNAYDSWRGQCERCSNVNNKAYRYYGAQGIRVLYSSREFVEWWLVACKKFPLTTRLTVNRLDTRGNYCFSNIELMAWGDNVAESNRRTKIKAVTVFCNDSGEKIADYPSMNVAAAVFGVQSQTVSKHCNRRLRPGRYAGHVVFRYKGEVL